MGESYLKELKELTPRLPDLMEIVRSFNGDCVVYDLDVGETIGFGLLKNPLVAVQKARLTPGAEFPLHLHNEIEHLILYKGDLTINFSNGERVNMILGDHCKIIPGEAHSCYTKGGAWLIAITIPASEGYPDAGQ